MASNQNNLAKLSSSFDPNFFENTPLVNGRIVGEIIILPRRHIALSSGFPAISLTRIEKYADISVTDAPDFHAIMRNEFIEVNNGSNVFTDEFSVTSVTGQNIVLDDNASNNALLESLYEDALVNGGGLETPSYTSWLSITGDNGIDYPITGLNLSTRTITVSGSLVSFSYIKLSQYRIGGDPSKVRVFSWRGRTISGSNISAVSGLRRRDQFQGHWSKFYSLEGSYAGTIDKIDIRASGPESTPNVNFGYIAAGNSLAIVRARIVGGDAISDGTNGLPRTGKTTHSPDTNVEIYQWLGRYFT